jgi:hypothetical protein
MPPGGKELTALCGDRPRVLSGTLSVQCVPNGPLRGSDPNFGSFLGTAQASADSLHVLSRILFSTLRPRSAGGFRAVVPHSVRFYQPVERLHSDSCHPGKVAGLSTKSADLHGETEKVDPHRHQRAVLGKRAAVHTWGERRFPHVLAISAGAGWPAVNRKAEKTRS